MVEGPAAVHAYGRAERRLGGEATKTSESTVPHCQPRLLAGRAVAVAAAASIARHADFAARGRRASVDALADVSSIPIVQSDLDSWLTSTDIMNIAACGLLANDISTVGSRPSVKKNFVKYNT